MDSLNTEEISQAIHEYPSDRWSYEKEQLSSFDAIQLKIYSSVVHTHTITHKLFNYHRNGYIEILRSDVFKHLEDEELERFVDENLQAYDELYYRDESLCLITIVY